MSYRHFEPVSKQIVILVGLTVVGFMAFGLALQYYRNVLFEQTLEDISVQNDELSMMIDEGHRDFEYYQSAQYKDKYAKENLGLVRPGESTLIITEQPENVTFEAPNEATLTEQQEVAYLELLHQMPVIEHWKLYLFHREKIEDLKRSV